MLISAEKLEVVTNCDHLARLKFAKSFPFAFTEHGAIQAANIPSAEPKKRPIGFVTPSEK
ncbi:hypothetical protein [Duganella sp. CY15W]|uniref:hypothetical protein n=1 Tax=Duganella sp. CY15W TaxID=2692172 RepID=UPI001E564679|nr:hypothetical protein [Duganella sp. CY15W]